MLKRTCPPRGLAFSAEETAALSPILWPSCHPILVLWGLLAYACPSSYHASSLRVVYLEWGSCLPAKLCIDLPPAVPPDIFLTDFRLASFQCPLSWLPPPFCSGAWIPLAFNQSQHRKEAFPRAEKKCTVGREGTPFFQFKSILPLGSFIGLVSTIQILSGFHSPLALEVHMPMFISELIGF